jgi:hypothetical protein
MTQCVKWIDKIPKWLSNLFEGELYYKESDLVMGCGQPGFLLGSQVMVHIIVIA